MMIRIAVLIAEWCNKDKSVTKGLIVLLNKWIELTVTKSAHKKLRALPARWFSKTNPLVVTASSAQF